MARGEICFYSIYFLHYVVRCVFVLFVSFWRRTQSVVKEDRIECEWKRRRRPNMEPQ